MNNPQIEALDRAVKERDMKNRKATVMVTGITANGSLLREDNGTMVPYTVEVRASGSIEREGEEPSNISLKFDVKHTEAHHFFIGKWLLLIIYSDETKSS